MIKKLENSNKQEKDLHYVNGYYTISIGASRENIVEMIDYALDFSKGQVYNKQHMVYKKDEWQQLREHWCKKIDPTVHFTTEISFSDLSDAFLFTLKFKGVKYE